MRTQEKKIFLKSFLEAMILLILKILMDTTITGKFFVSILWRKHMIFMFWVRNGLVCYIFVYQILLLMKKIFIEGLSLFFLVILRH